MAVACSATVGSEPTQGAASTAVQEPEAATDLAQELDPEDDIAESTPTGDVPVVGEPARDRIVVATGGGQVYLINPDGSNRLDLVSDTSREQGSQPVWSPDGRRIAWSERSGPGFSIVSTNIDGTERRRAETLFSGYYGFWDPTSTQLGFLGNAVPGTGLVLDQGTGLPLDSVVDSDTFYYFSWSPDGTEWVVHSGSGMRIVGLDGSRRTISLDDSQFRAPIWTDDNQLVLGLRRSGRNVIALVDPDTTEVDELLEVGDAANFVLDPTGRFLAIETISFSEATEPDNGITEVAFQQQEQRVELLRFDLQTRESEVIFDQPTAGFWWSPNGESLAALVVSDTAAAGQTQWLVWQDGDSYRTDPFRVTPTFGSTYVPFFDQFAQSVTPWAPDSSRFVFAGTAPDGESGVFVQPAQPAAPAQRIAADGAIAFWSPT